MPREGTEQQLNVGEKISLQDATQLPAGCWVSVQNGLLIESQPNESITAIISQKPQEFVLVGDPGRTPYNTMRQRARQANVEPVF